MQDGISETVHHLQEGLSEGVHWLQDGLAHQRQQLSVGRSAVHRVLEEALSGVLSWPTARWPTYVYMGGAMTCLLLSSACHLLGCCQVCAAGILNGGLSTAMGLGCGRAMAHASLLSEV